MHVKHVFMSDFHQERKKYPEDFLNGPNWEKYRNPRKKVALLGIQKGKTLPSLNNFELRKLGP